MRAKLETKAAVLMAMMSEDRREVRDTRSAIYNIISLLTVASFALTAFLLEKKVVPGPSKLCILADAVVIVFIWAFFLRYKADLYYARQALKARQDLIRGLNESDTTDLNPFPSVSKVVPDIRDRELWWLPFMATLAILIKAVTMWRML